MLKEVVENKGNVSNSMDSGKKIKENKITEEHVIITAQKLTRTTIYRNRTKRSHQYYLYTQNIVFVASNKGDERCRKISADKRKSNRITNTSIGT